MILRNKSFAGRKRSNDSGSNFGLKKRRLDVTRLHRESDRVEDLEQNYEDEEDCIVEGKYEEDEEDNQTGLKTKKKFKEVCKYWLRGKCLNASDCEFMHEYEYERVPRCFFDYKFGECQNPGCMFRHETDKRRTARHKKSSPLAKKDNPVFRIKNDDERFNRLAQLQAEKGFWEMNEELVSVLGMSIYPWKPPLLDEESKLSDRMWSTALCISWLNDYAASLESSQDSSYGEKGEHVYSEALFLATEWLEKSKTVLDADINLDQLVKTASKVRRKAAKLPSPKK